jgi:formate/nitrite transporter
VVDDADVGRGADVASPRGAAEQQWSIITAREAADVMGDDTHSDSTGFDALLPAAVARKAQDIGVAKANMPVDRMFALAILAGSFIALGALFSTVVTAGGEPGSGVIRLLGGVVVSLGLILVVVSGAELFTGNTLIVMSVAGRRLPMRQLLRCWAIVYVGNAVGALATAMLVIWSGRLDDASIAARTAEIADAKTSLTVPHAFFSAVLANVLVCLAVWMAMSARTVTDKVLAIVPPVSAFVAIGLEHSIANLYFVPVVLLDQTWSDSTIQVGENVTWSHFLTHNLVPSTVGNIVGGAALVGLVYWFVYLRPRRDTTAIS